MPGKKRKAAAGGTTTKMWGSSSPTSSSNNASSSRRKASSSRRVGGAAVVVSSSGGNDSKVEKMFEEICDEDNPDAASMEGKEYDFFFQCIMFLNLAPNKIAPSSTLTLLSSHRNLQTLRTAGTRPPRGRACPRLAVEVRGQ